MNYTENKLYDNKLNSAVLDLIEMFNLNILDIGCGTGINAKFLKQKGNIIDGITLSNFEKDLASLHMRNVYIFNLEDGLPNLENKYDIVLCSHVLEHIAYPQKLLKGISNILKDNGELILAVPNIMHYKSRLQLIFGNFPEKDAGIWDNTHLRWYTINKIRNLLTNNGFEIQLEKFDCDLPFGLISKYFPKFIYSLLVKFLLFLSPGLFSKQLIYAAKKN